MRLLVLSNLYPPDVLGGYEVLSQDVVERLRARGHRVRVLTTGAFRRGEHGVIRALRLARSFEQEPGRDRVRHLLAAAWNRVATEACLATQGPFDAALVMSMRRLGVEPLRVLQEHGVPFVATVNDDWPAAYGTPAREGWRRLVLGVVEGGPWLRNTFRGIGVGDVVYLSESVRREVRAAVPSFPEGIVQAQGVDLRRFRARGFRAIQPPVELLFVGRLHPTKAPDVAIEALASLRRRDVDARLTLAGAPVNEAYGDELRRLSVDLGVDGHVRWLGHVARASLPAIYREADIMLFLNRWDEPQGLTYMEAMACGVPVVAYPRGGARELLDAWPAAELAAACSGDAVADSVQLLTSRPDLQRRRVEAGERMLQNHASLDKYVDVIVRVIERATTTGFMGPNPRGTT